MNKKKNKGFSLIEMMVVIAIIAILVGIFTPMIMSHTTKANAATNAANLRAVKGQVSTLLLQGDITYDTSVRTAAEVIAEAEIKSMEALLNGDYTLAALLQIGIASLEELQLLPDGHQLSNLMNSYYAEDGKVNIDGTILTAPAAKPIKVGNMTLRKGTEMSVTVGTNDVVVTYGGINIDTFAFIAEHGDDTDIDMTQVPHDHIDSNRDGLCDVCTKELSTLEQGNSALGGMLSGSHVCSDEDSNCKCDDPNCGMDLPHDIPNRSHTCRKCGYTTPCVWSFSKSGHTCTICRTSSSHSGDTTCTFGNGCNYVHSTCTCSNYIESSGCNKVCTNGSCNGHDPHDGKVCGKDLGWSN